MKKEPWFRQQQTRIQTFLEREVWDLELGGLPTFRAWGVRLARILYLAVRGLLKNECLNRASALTYITVLSLVPTIALAASVAKGFGAWDHLLETTVEPFLDTNFGKATGPATTGDAESGAEGVGSVEGDAGSLPGDEAGPPSEEALSAPDEPPPPDEDGAAPPTESAEKPDGQAPEDESSGPQEPPAQNASQMRVIIEKILGVVEEADYRTIGVMGLAFILLTVIKLLTSIENVLNRIWGVEQARSFVRKVTDYVALVVVTPLLLITSTAATGALQSNAFVEYLTENLKLGPVLTFGFKLLPLVSLWLGFGFLYMALPNTRVKVVSALVGGILGGTLWQVFQILHVDFQVGLANYNRVYAGFAAFPIFLVWVYTSWVIVLLGAQLAWAYQAEPEYRELMRDAPSTVTDREQLAVHAVVAIARAFARGEQVLSTSSLAARFAVPPRAIGESLAPLVAGGILAKVADGDGYVPSRSLDTIRIQSVLDAMHGAKTNGVPEHDQSVARVLAALRDELAKSPHNVTLRELATSPAPESPAPSAPPAPPPE